MKVGILTGGGDCPGLNAVIRAVVRRSEQLGFEVTGIREAWRGLLEHRHFKLTGAHVSGILHEGGTILGTSRANPFQVEGGPEEVERTADLLGLSGLIVVGGDGSLNLGRKMHERGRLKVIGVPKTIDNDIAATDRTFGFDTAVQIVTEAIDRLHTTAESHRRVIVVEVMGRTVGHIAVHAGLASGADAILVPEYPTTIDHVVELIERRHRRGKLSSIVVVAEGAKVSEGEDAETAHIVTGTARTDDFGRPRFGGVGAWLGAALEARLGIETRVSVLGHVQRGGSPVASDRVLASRFGLEAAELAAAGEWGQMVALRGQDIVRVTLAEATAGVRGVDPAVWEAARVFFG